jgi:hypothetical protein
MSSHDGFRQLRLVVRQHHEPGLGKAAREDELMVVDRLAQGREPRDDDRALSRRERREDRAYPCVRHDRPRRPHELEKSLEGDVVDAPRPGRADGRRAALGDDRLVHGEPLHGGEQAIERLCGPDGDENHDASRTLPA